VQPERREAMRPAVSDFNFRLYRWADPLGAGAEARVLLICRESAWLKPCPDTNRSRPPETNSHGRHYGKVKGMAVAKQSRQKHAPPTSTVPARKERSPRLQGQELRRALEELRDTKSERRAQELKRVISDSICGS